MCLPISFETRNTDTMIKLFIQSLACPRLMKIKTLIFASLLVGALVTLLSAPLQAAESSQHPTVQPADTFVILLSGPYEPVPQEANVDCKNLGLLQVNLCDGSFTTTKIFPVSGLPKGASGQANSGEGPRSGERQAQNTIGNFYVQFADIHAAYDLPGGALTMIFTTNNTVPVPDGQGGTFFVGTIDLDITEATGVYASFLGGHNKMVDVIHQLADGTFVEHCYCIISRPAPTAINRHDSEGGTERSRRNDARA
jgi:hypothetical protein